MFQVKKKDPIQWRPMRATPPSHTELINSVVNGNIDNIQKLLHSNNASSPPVSVRDTTFGRPAICWAKDVATLKVLLEAGADVNSRDFDGYTPLHTAVVGGRVDVVEFLVNEAKADKYAKDISGFTPYDWAVELGKEELKTLVSVPTSTTAQRQQHRQTQEQKQQTKQEPHKKETHKKETQKEQKTEISSKKTQEHKAKQTAPEVRKNVQRQPRPPLQLVDRKPYLFTLTQHDVTAILNSTDNKENVKLIGVDYNWDPPVSTPTSGRSFDFLQVWVAVKGDVAVESVSLKGCHINEKGWNILLDFDYVADLGHHKLFLLQHKGRLPLEFVIVLTTQTQEHYYDNNGGYGLNYKLSPYQGRFASAQGGRDHVKMFDGFAHVHVVLIT